MTEPTVSFRELLAANPDTVTDDTEILITAGELRDRLDELNRLCTQADEDAALVGWYLYANEPHSMRTAVLSNHFGARAQAALDARMAALPDGEPRDRAAQLAMLRSAGGNAGALAEIWYFSNDEDESSELAYPNRPAAQNAAAEAFATEDPDLEPCDPAELSWRHHTFPGSGREVWLMDWRGTYTGWSVNRLQIAGATQIETEWTVARHGLRSIQYGDAMTEQYARDEVREELECGETASVAYRTVGPWQHEDPEAQQHADALNAAMKAGA